MTRILVLGGYGGFGGRISKRLVAEGHEVLVAGRDAGRARAFCKGNRGLTPIVCDRAAVDGALSDHHPAILVDASGPFQAMDMRVPRACIANGVHYLDIADARAFVTGIGELDEAARAAGITVISGASSVPALSGAVIGMLARGMESIDAVEMAISASNKASAGPAVAASILSQAGQTLRLWSGKRWSERFGWQDLRRIGFAVAGQPPIAPRIVALVDVPDLALLPDRLPGRPAVRFRAGTELRFQNLALWLASWLVRWRLVRTLSPLARILQPLQRLTRSAGSDRSAMVVGLFGRMGERRIERLWTLIASDGDGPEIPTLAIAPLVARILAGAEPHGARDAGGNLTIGDYQPAFDRLSIAHETIERELPPPLYARVMGARFDALPPAVRAMHAVLRNSGASGTAEVAGASNWLGSMIARIMRFPPAGHYPLHVEFDEVDGEERWTRDFGGRRFRSRLSQRGPWLVERFGPLRFAFDLPSDQIGLKMVMRRWWFGPLPLPLALAPRSEAREWEAEGVFNFDVPIALPLIGRLVQYCGTLTRL